MTSDLPDGLQQEARLKVKGKGEEKAPLTQGLLCCGARGQEGHTGLGLPGEVPSSSGQTEAVWEARPRRAALET